jgi:hypothetical protein
MLSGYKFEEPVNFLAVLNQLRSMTLKSWFNKFIK